MAVAEIQQAFMEGVEQIYSVLFTDGVSDGIEFYYLNESETKVDSVYRESKKKVYSEPILLISNAKLSISPQEYVMDKKCDALFKVPCKTLLNKEFDLSKDGLEVIRKGKINFHGVDYKIDDIKPTTFVDNVFLIYEFYCTEV